MFVSTDTDDDHSSRSSMGLLCGAQTGAAEISSEPQQTALNARQI
jgi:hypothetical protein